MKNRFVIIATAAICFCSLFLQGGVTVTAAEITNKETTVTEEKDHQVGGGYAATGQIPGINFLPVLYNASNGLPTSEANCVLAASDGYIWIGGYSGIVRYDGVNFERLPVTDGLTSGRGFFEDSRGRIWVATNDSGVVVVDGAERMHYSKKDGLGSDSVRSFAEDSRGNIYIASTAGISYVDPTMELHRIDDVRINNERILRLVSDVNGIVYGHDGNGNVFTVNSNGIDDYKTSSEMHMEKVTTILADPEEPGVLYFGTETAVVYQGRYGYYSENMKKIDTDPADSIHWMHYACNRLWVSSQRIAGYVNENDEFVPFESVPIKDSYEMMTSDHQGNMWFASSRYGVMKLVADEFLDVTGAAGMDQEVVNTTCKRRSDIYIGTDDGLHIIDKNHHIKENNLSSYLKGVRVRCLMNDREDNTWISTFSADMGLLCLNRFGTVTDFTVEDGLPSNDIRCTYEMKDGSVIVGTNDGLAVIKDGKVKESYGAAEGMKNTMILTVCEGDDGEIMAGSDGDGIYIFDKGQIDRIGTENGIGSDVVMRIKRDEKRDVIWIITSNSVEYIKDGEINRVTSFPYNNNFDVIYGKDDDLWFLSSAGIYVINAADVLNDNIVYYKLYNQENGLTSIPISHCYSGTDSEGTLYIAGQTGVSVVDMDDMYDFSGRTQTGIRSVFYEGEEVLPDGDGRYVIPKGKGRVQVNPAVFDYTIANPLIKIYMEGVDEEGVTTTQSNLMPLEYTGLKYGNHAFHIVILDDKGDMVSDKIFHIVKTPSFYERWSTRLLVLCFIMLLVAIIIWRVMSNTVIRKQYAQIREAREDAEKANHAKTRFLANISNEIRTPINTIMGLDEMILREKAKNVPEDYYIPVTRNARNIRYAAESLLSLINDLMDVSSIESGTVHLVEREYDTEDLLRGIIFMIRGRAEEKKLHFDINVDGSIPKSLYGDSNKIRQIVLNLLTNAVKYTQDGGISLTVMATDRTGGGVELLFSIKDSGIGVKKENIENMFHAFERMESNEASAVRGIGLGLDISRQYAESMGGELSCESVYGEGSEFFFRIKQKICDGEAIGIFREEKTDEDHVVSFIAPDADVLLADGDTENLQIMRGLLRPTKVFVTTSFEGEDCIAKISRSNIDVAFINPALFGTEVERSIKKIRKTRPDLPVYALVDSDMSGSEEYYRSLGFDGYLIKPVDAGLLERNIMRHLSAGMMTRPS